MYWKVKENYKNTAYLRERDILEPTNKIVDDVILNYILDEKITIIQ